MVQLVESAATIACASAGLDTSGESVPYIAGWGDGTTDTLREYAVKVDELAGELGRACGIEGPVGFHALAVGPV